MAEHGMEEDLDWLHRAKKATPYSSKKIERFLEIAEQQISERVGPPHKDLRNFFNLSQEAFDRLISVPDGPTMEDLVTIKESLRGLFEHDEIDRWLDAPNKKFAGKRPIEAMAEGQADRIIQLLARLEDGAHY